MPLYFPAGTYKITQSLDFSSITNGNFQVTGAAPLTSSILVAANNVTAISYTGSGSTHPQVSDLGFVTATPSLTGTTAIGFTGTSISTYMGNANIDNVNINGFCHGISLSACLLNAISNVTIVSLAGSGTGVSLNDAGETSLVNVAVGSGVAGSNPIGFLVQGPAGPASLSEGVWLSNCVANGAYIGLQITDQHFGSATACSFTSCPGGGVVSTNTPGGNGTQAWSFSACEFNSSPTTAAVLMDPLASDNQFDGCFEYSSLYGMQLQGSGNTVTGNRFEFNTNGDVLLDGASQSNITGNNCLSPAPATFSIQEQALDGVDPSLNLIDDNTVYVPVSPLVPGSGSIAVNNLAETNPVPPEPLPCFAAGTRIATATGATAVEALCPGDLVRLAGGGTAPVQWIGHRHVTCRGHPRPSEVLPVRVRVHAFAPGAPARDLWLSPDHAVFTDAVLIPIRYLINGGTIAQEDLAEITYFHIELPAHGVILAEGLPCESYLDTGNRAAFATAAPDRPAPNPMPKEIGGPPGPEPTRYGDWQFNGRVTDF